jgi:WD40 repeat protein
MSSIPTTAPFAKVPTWQVQLSATHFVNWVAITNDASRVIAGMYYYPYQGTSSNDVHGVYGAYCLDSTGARLWSDEFEGDEGVFAVAISGDGQVAAAGGLLSGGKFSDRPDAGLLRIYNANTGARLVDYTGVRRRVNSVALSYDGSVLGAVASSKLYVYVKKNGIFPTDASIPVAAGDFLDSVAVHPGGDWVAACDRSGTVYLVTIKNGAVEHTYKWTAPVALPLLSIAVSQDGGSLVVGGGNYVYLLTAAAIKSETGPIGEFSIDGHPPNRFRQDVRWVGISGDGRLLSVVSNLQQTGELRTLNYDGSTLNLAWKAALARNPNSTSIDAAGRYVTACVGEPVGTPGSFLLFDAAIGAKLWDFAVGDMCWPMFISADGSAIAAGSDEGDLYSFRP